MIAGMDMLTILAPGCDGSVHGLTRCSTNKPYDAREIYNQLCTQINKKFYQNQVDGKFFSTREYTILGYHYFKETFGVEVEDIVKYINAPDREVTDSITEDELMQLAKTYFNSNLPVNNKFNWDICLCLNPIASENKTNDDDKTNFVIFTRMHHTLGDGLVIYNVLVNNLFQFGPEFKTYSENLVNKCKNLEKKKAGTHVYKYGHKILIDKPCILRDGQRHVKTMFTNIVEQPSSMTYLDKIKLIRQKYPGVMTFNIFMTAYSASLADYYIKYSKPKDIPENMETTHPVQLDIRRYLDIYSCADKIKLSNEVASFQFTCPIVPRSKKDVPIEDYLIDRMLTIKDDFDRAMNSMDIQASYIWTAVYFAVFPYWITRNLFEGVFITSLTTCMPGGPKLKLFNNDSVDHISYFLPKQYYSTLVLAINTYNHLLQIGMTANEEKVETLTKLNEIRDGIFKYLDLLYAQCVKLD